MCSLCVVEVVAVCCVVGVLMVVVVVGVVLLRQWLVCGYCSWEYNAVMVADLLLLLWWWWWSSLPH